MTRGALRPRPPGHRIRGRRYPWGRQGISTGMGSVFTLHVSELGHEVPRRRAPRDGGMVVTERVTILNGTFDAVTQDQAVEALVERAAQGSRGLDRHGQRGDPHDDALATCAAALRRPGVHGGRRRSTPDLGAPRRSAPACPTGSPGST